MKLAVFETEQWEHDACLRLRPAYEVSCVRDILDEASARIHAKAEIISSFVYSQLDARVLAHFAQLRLIATRSTGYDHIDLGYCQSRGIIVCNVPGYGNTSVAEHVFALLLGLARKIADAAERTRRGRFDQAGLRGFELKGRTIAVIGAGRIGMRVIEIARGFSMDVIAVDARPDELAAQRLGFRYASLDAALGQADIVTLHVPATPETRRLIAEREFALMKPGAVRGHLLRRAQPLSRLHQSFPIPARLLGRATELTSLNQSMHYKRDRGARSLLARQLAPSQASPHRRKRMASERPSSVQASAPGIVEPHAYSLVGPRFVPADQRVVGSPPGLGVDDKCHCASLVTTNLEKAEQALKPPGSCSFLRQQHFGLCAISSSRS